MIISSQPSELFALKIKLPTEIHWFLSLAGISLDLYNSRTPLFSHTRRRAYPDAASRTAPHRLLNDPSRLADFVPYTGVSLPETIIRSRGGRRMHLSTRYVLKVLSIGATRGHRLPPRNPHFESHKTYPIVSANVLISRTT